MQEPTFDSGVVRRPDGGRVVWRLDGATAELGPMAVLLGPEHRTMAVWPADAVAAVCSSESSCLRIDWRDQGGSDGDALPLTLDTLCDDVLAAIDAVGSPQVLVGVGLGALVARHVSVARPGTDLVLVNATDDYLATTVEGPDEADVVRVVLPLQDGRPEHARRRLVREVRTLSGSAEGPDGEAGSIDAVVERWLAAGQRSADRHRSVLLTGHPPDRARELDAARSVTVLHGVENRLVPIGHGAGVAARFGVPLRAVEGAGHHLGPLLRGHVIEVVTSLLTVPGPLRGGL